MVVVTKCTGTCTISQTCKKNPNKLKYRKKLTLILMELKEVEFGSFDGREGGEHMGVGFLEIS